MPALPAFNIAAAPNLACLQDGDRWGELWLQRETVDLPGSYSEHFGDLGRTHQIHAGQASAVRITGKLSGPDTDLLRPGRGRAKSSLLRGSNQRDGRIGRASFTGRFPTPSR